MSYKLYEIKKKLNIVYSIMRFEAQRKLIKHSLHEPWSKVQLFLKKIIFDTFCIITVDKSEHNAV